MKISEIEPILLERRLKEPVSWPTDSSEIRRLTLLKVTTDNDLIGWGTAPDVQSIDSIKSIFIGQDPFDREALWEKIGWRGTFQSRRLMQTLSGINIALYDIIGKAINKPVYKILGGSQYKAIKTYMNGLYFNNDEKIKKITAEQIDRGFKAVKLKIGYPEGIRKDIEKVEMLRKEFGYDIMGDTIDMTIQAQLTGASGFEPAHTEVLCRDKTGRIFQAQSFDQSDLERSRQSISEGPCF